MSKQIKLKEENVKMTGKYGVREVLELIVFDLEGNLVTNLDSLKNSRMVISKDTHKIRVEDALLDADLLRFRQYSEAGVLSDYGAWVQELNQYPVQIKADNGPRECKLVARTVVRSAESLEDREVHYVIPRAEIVDVFDIDARFDRTSTFRVEFDIKPDEDGNLFSIYGL